MGVFALYTWEACRTSLGRSPIARTRIALPLEIARTRIALRSLGHASHCQRSHCDDASSTDRYSDFWRRTGQSTLQMEGQAVQPSQMQGARERLRRSGAPILRHSAVERRAFTFAVDGFAMPKQRPSIPIGPELTGSGSLRTSARGKQLVEHCMSCYVL
jgi:hypothetical protein